MADPSVPVTCPNCSRPVDARAFFCPHCGTAVRFATPSAPVTALQTSPGDLSTGPTSRTPGTAQTRGSMLGVRLLGVVVPLALLYFPALNARAPLYLVVLVAAVVVVLTQPPERRLLRAFAVAVLLTFVGLLTIGILLALGALVVCALLAAHH